MKNKNFLTVAIVALMFLPSLIFAQDNKTDFREDLSFGVKIGTNYSNVYDAQGEEFKADPKFGLVAGGFVSIPIGAYIGIQPEILFSQKGFKADGVILGSTYKLTRTTSYLDIPLYFAFKPSEFFTLVAGPEFSYLLMQKDAFENASTTIEQETEF
ncbi:MAG: PorT family protein [Bacteroidales bacterium]|nr:PorT family protein [Bacteroidales bacterium]